MQWFTGLLYSALGCVLGLYLLLRWKFSYWQRHGVQYLEPEFFWGNAKKILKREISEGEQIAKFYFHFKRKGLSCGGLYFSIFPRFIPIDLDLIKDIFHKEFHHFSNRGSYFDKEVDPLQGNLGNLKDDRWKYLRTKLSPTFSSGKLRLMLQTILECTKSLQDLLNESADNNSPIDVKDVASRFIGSCAFGLKCNTLKDIDSEFKRHSHRVFQPSLIDKFKSLLVLAFSTNFLRKFRMKITNAEVEAFFTDIVRKVIDFREKENVSRNDFMDLMIQLKNRGQLVDDGTSQLGKTNEDNAAQGRLTFNEIAAQCFLFFVGGHETSTVTMSSVFLELALNKHIQDNLRQEIEAVLEKHNGNITVDSVVDMKYLDKVINETMRRHPPVGALPRECTKTYRLPGTGIVVEKGMIVTIPIHGIHMDPDIYPDPEKFDPERFSDFNRAQRHPYSFLPFGEGPRECLGTRFALLQTKLGVISVIRQFNLSVNCQTKLPLNYITTNSVTTTNDKVWLNVDKLY